MQNKNVKLRWLLPLDIKIKQQYRLKYIMVLIIGLQKLVITNYKILKHTVL